MKIHYMSDIHLEFGNLLVPEVEADVLVLAGDIHVGLRGVNWINRLAQEYPHVIFVFGNHEFYHNDIDELRARFPEEVVSNVHVLDNKFVDIDGYRFIGSTLWSEVTPYTFRRMTDSQVITKNYNKAMWLDQDVWNEHKLAKYYIHSRISKDIDNIIITHHAPTFKMIDTRRYGHNEMNSGYATEIIDEFKDYDIPVWISGHTHSCKDIQIGNTLCVSNCRGYAGYDEVEEFKIDKVLEIE